MGNAKDDWDFHISGLVKNSDETDVGRKVIDFRISDLVNNPNETDI